MIRVRRLRTTESDDKSLTRAEARVFASPKKFSRCYTGWLIDVDIGRWLLANNILLHQPQASRLLDKHGRQPRARSDPPGEPFALF